MIEVLLLGRQHGYEPLRQAIDQALTVGASDVGVIRYLLERQRMEPRVPAIALQVGWLEQYERPLPSLQNYDTLLTSAATTESVQ
jgi:hypothetical protein